MIAYIFAFASRFAETASHETAAQEGGGGLLSPNAGLAFWTVLTFILLLVILKKVAWKPILAALEERETKIAESLDLADKARKEASDNLAENKKIIALAQDEARKIIDESRQFAAELKEKLVEDSRKQAAKVLEEASLEIERKREEMTSELKSFTVNLSVEIAEKILKKNLDTTAQKELASEYLKEISSGNQ